MKTLCIYHSVDLDGWMSAAIVNHYFNQQNNINASAGGDIDNVEFLGWNYGDSIPDLSEWDSVIMCDISFPKEEMDKLVDKFGSEFVWIDHHISAIKANGIFNEETKEDSSIRINGLRITTFSACELTWNFFFRESIPEIVRVLGRYDCFGHKGTSEEEYVLQFQYGARAFIRNRIDAYKYLISCIKDKGLTIKIIYDAGCAIYDSKCGEAKAHIRKAFTLLFGEYRFMAINVERLNPINFGIKYHELEAIDGYFYDGVASFWIEPDGIHFSLYNDNGKVDCSKIASKFGGGGHKGAAGFIMPFNDNFKFDFKITDFKSMLSTIKFNS